MRKRIRQFALVTLCAIMLFMLCACDSGTVNTELNLGDDFSGTRVMSFDIKQSDIAAYDPFGLFTPKPADIVDILAQSCPAELKLDTSYSGKDATCVFTLEFTSQSDYQQKIAALLGRAPSVTFAPPVEDIFTSGITLKEDFSSSELFGWAENALAAKYPEYAGKLTLSGKDGTTAVTYGGSTRTSSAKINIMPVSTTLDRVAISTTRYGDNDYSRTISFYVSAENLNLIGKDNLSSFFESRCSDIRSYVSSSWSGDNTCYSVMLKKGTLEELTVITQAILPGSTVEYFSDERASAFTESGTLSEHFSFEGLKCNADGTCDVTLEYIAGDDTDFSENKDIEGGTLSNNGKSLTIQKKSVTGCDASVVSVTRYIIDAVEVVTEMSLTGNTTVSVNIKFPDASSRSAATRARDILTEQYSGSGLRFDVQQLGASSGVVVSGNDASKTGSDAYALVIYRSGTPQEISESFSALGEGNSLTIENGKALSLYSNSNIKHSINISSLTDMAGYAGNVSYTFNSHFTKLSDAGWRANGEDGKYRDIVLGENRRNVFSETDIASSNFTITYSYSRFNVIFALLALIIAIALIWLIMIAFSAIARKLYHGSAKRKEQLTYEAVKTVALANIPEEEQTELAELPKELVSRPTIVLEPRNDDGLDEDNDEPEGMTLFASALRILLIAASVLFFFPVCNVQRTSVLALNGTSTLSGWNLFYGKELFGFEFSPYRPAILLLILPLVIIALLAARRTLPRLILPIVVSAASVCNIFFMLRLPDQIEKRLDIISNQLSDHITTPEMQWGYNYSMIMYLLVAIGGILLLFGDAAYLLNQRRKKNTQ